MRILPSNWAREAESLANEQCANVPKKFAKDLQKSSQSHLVLSNFSFFLMFAFLLLFNYSTVGATLLFSSEDVFLTFILASHLFL